MVSRDPKIFHHLPVPALGASFGTLALKGGQIVEVTRALVPPEVRGRDPEHGPEKDQPESSFTINVYPPCDHDNTRQWRFGRPLLVTWMSSSWAPRCWVLG